MLIAIAVAVVIVSGAARTAGAQSNYPPTPVQGPPPNLSDSSKHFVIDTFITHHCCEEMTGLTDGLYDQVDRAVDENNAAYGVDSSSAVVTATKTRYSPWMYSTQFTDRPNQNIVLVSYHIEYDISDIYWHGIPYPFSRTAGQSVDIEISCEGIYLVVNLPQMTEGQVYVPDAKAVLSSPVPPVNAQYSGKLVIIANMWQVPQNMEDSAFLAFDKASNWGAGTPIINTPKTWSYTNTRISRKPIYVRSNGYEVTLQIIGPPGSIYN